MVYIRLFHGRSDPKESLDDWGSDGPVFGPYDFVHTTYGSHVMLGCGNDNCDELYAFDGDMLYYDGVYYGDWSVFDEKAFKNAKFTCTLFDAGKARLPKKLS